MKFLRGLESTKEVFLEDREAYRWLLAGGYSVSGTVQHPPSKQKPRSGTCCYSVDSFMYTSDRSDRSDRSETSDISDISTCRYDIVAQDLHCTYPTQETCPRSYRANGSHPAAWARSHRSHRSYRSCRSGMYLSWNTYNNSSRLWSGNRFFLWTQRLWLLRCSRCEPGILFCNIIVCGGLQISGRFQWRVWCLLHRMSQGVCASPIKKKRPSTSQHVALPMTTSTTK